MAFLEDLFGKLKLREAWPRIQRNFNAINDEVVKHKTSTAAHKAEHITYSGEVVAASNIKEAVDALDTRIGNIVGEAGDSNTEIVDARQPTTGAAYPTLKARLDTEQASNAAQLAEKATNITNTIISSGTILDFANSVTVTTSIMVTSGFTPTDAPETAEGIVDVVVGLGGRKIVNFHVFADPSVKTYRRFISFGEWYGGDWKPITEKIGTPEWINATLINGWVNYGDPYLGAGYYKDPFGRVYLTGLIKSGALLTNAFILPVGYRPGGRSQFTCVSNEAFGIGEIDSNGSVVIAAGSNLSFSLAGVSFKAEL